LKRFRLKSAFHPAILISIFAMAIIAATLLFEVESLRSALLRVNHTDQVLSANSELLKLNLDMESGLRGFQYTGNPEFLQSYTEAGQIIPAKFDDAARLLVKPSQKNQLATMRRDFEDWQRLAASAIAARKFNVAAHVEATPQVRYRETLKRKLAMDHIRAEHQDFADGELALLGERQRGVRTRSFLLVISCFLFVIAGGGGLGLFVKRNLEKAALQKSLQLRVGALANMAAELAHEINNPLAIVFAEACTLAAADPSPHAPASASEVHRVAEAIIQASGRAITSSAHSKASPAKTDPSPPPSPPSPSSSITASTAPKPASSATTSNSASTSTPASRSSSAAKPKSPRSSPTSWTTPSPPSSTPEPASAGSPSPPPANATKSGSTSPTAPHPPAFPPSPIPRPR
jgi:CHASE3 domain sensor protein